MRRTITAAALGGLILLAGCDDQTDPSPPPTAEDALTTVTAAPVTDEVDETTEAAPATQEPTEPAATTEAPAADGPPEMPAAAEEQTEEGAEAFALHYIDMVNYTGISPEVGLLEPLSSDGCASCVNYEENVRSLAENDAANDGDAATVQQATATGSGESYLVLVELEQNSYNVVTRDGTVLDTYEHVPGVQFMLTLEPSDPWLVQEIQVSANR